MRGRLTGVAFAVCAACALPLATASGQSSDVVEVTANGNAIYDQSNLSFRPPSVTARVGQTVRWTNTDVIVPHTATEDHGLWDLAGSYGATPANPSGFGPGTTVQRVFEAGTHHYYCRVHPMQMHGVVAVPVVLSSRLVVHSRQVTKKIRVRTRRRDRRGRRIVRVRRVRVTVTTTTAFVAATWASGAPAAGEVYDVQRRLGDGAWETFASGTRSASGEFVAGGPGKMWSVRARLRSASDADKATDWSPVVAVLA
jgi:plastocyanin